jgi:hypothetical protein
VTSGVTHPRQELIPNLRDTFKTVAVRCNKSRPACLRRTIGTLTPAMALLESGQFVWRSVMGSYKRVFDPLDLEIIDLVYEAALVEIAARDPLSDPIKEQERQEALKKLVFAVAQPGAVEFDHLLDKVLEFASELLVSPASARAGARSRMPNLKIA